MTAPSGDASSRMNRGVGTSAFGSPPMSAIRPTRSGSRRARCNPQRLPIDAPTKSARLIPSASIAWQRMPVVSEPKRIGPVVDRRAHAPARPVDHEAAKTAELADQRRPVGACAAGPGHEDHGLTVGRPNLEDPESDARLGDVDEALDGVDPVARPERSLRLPVALESGVNRGARGLDRGRHRALLQSVG